MSWQSNWGTVKVTNARACALYYEVANVGKTIESSKKRVVWRLKVEEGREFEITLTHSLASGKKVLRVDSIVKYTSQSLSFGDWDYVFNLPGGHCVHIIIKPSMELNDMYDLIIDNVSFRRLPDRLNPSARSKNGGVTSATNSNTRKPTSSSSYSYSSGNYGGSGSRNASFGPWECPRCTLVNEKPLAPICEACGGPKPEQIIPEARIRAKTVAESRSPAPAVSNARPASKSTTAAPSSSSGEFFSSSFSATTPADVAKGFDAFEAAPEAARKKSDHDISSMLAGLDFTPAAPPAAETVPVDSSFGGTSGVPVPTPEGDASSRTASGDLWESNMVDLNLRPEDKKLQPRSAKSYQTLEQARMQAPKEKVAVLQPPPPPPPQMPVQMAPMPMVAPMGYYASPAAQVTQGGYYNGVQSMYATTAAPGYGMGGQPQQFAGAAGYGGGAQVTGAYQFMTAAPSAPGAGVHKQQTMLSADPFATLS